MQSSPTQDVGELHGSLCDALRGICAKVVAAVLLPGGTHKIIWGRDSR